MILRGRVRGRATVLLAVLISTACTSTEIEEDVVQAPAELRSSPSARGSESHGGETAVPDRNRESSAKADPSNECTKEHTCPLTGKVAVAQVQGYERVTWDEAVSWWPHRPVLKAAWLPSALDESVFVGRYGPGGGRRIDPRGEEVVTVKVFYAPHEAPVETHNGNQIMDAGGVLFIFNYYPPGKTAAFSNPIWKSGSVEVREQTANYIESRDGPPEGDVLFIYWSEALKGNNGTLQWTFRSNPSIRSRDTLVRVINEASELD